MLPDRRTSAPKVSPLNRYRGILTGTALGLIPILSGILLQWIAGTFDWNRTGYPVNVIAGIAFILVLYMVHLMKSKVKILSKAISYHTAIPAIGAAMFMTLALGFIGQEPESPTGFLQDLLSSWPFILSYSWMTAILGLTAINDMHSFKLRKSASTLCHIGLFTALTCGALGVADIRMLTMTVHNGTAEWQAHDRDGYLTTLPCGIELESITADSSQETMPGTVSAILSIHSPKDGIKQTTVKINSPAKADRWTIYLSDYDDRHGPAHLPMATLTLVSDPWLPGVYCGIILLALGSVCLIFTPMKPNPPSK